MKTRNTYFLNRFAVALHIILIVAVLFCNDEKEGILGILGFGAEKMILLAAFCVMLVAVKNKNIKFNIQSMAFFVVYTVFCFYLIYNYVYSYSRSSTRPFMIRMFVLLFLTCFIYSIAHLERIAKYIRVYIIIVAICYVLTYPFMGIDAGIYMNMQYTTTVLSAGLGFMIPQIFAEKSKKALRRNILSILLIIFVIMLTGKRALLIVPILLFVVIALISGDNQKYKKLSIIVGIALIAFGVVLAVSPSMLNSITRMGDISSDETFNSRTFFWAYALMLFRKHPLFGIGFGTFPLHIKSGGMNSGEFHYLKAYGAHNIYYQMLAEIGLIGLILFVLAMIVGMVFTIKVIKKVKKRKEERLLNLVLSSLYCQIWFILYGFTGNPLYMAGQVFTYFFGIIIAMSVHYEIDRKKRERS